ncbi:MAG: YbhB YbcL family protein [Bacteroidetes bacterium]|nr:YbhB YbcL family protein [Bacteroidota bacterium]
MFTFSCTSYADKSEIPLKHVHRSVVGGKNISPGFTWTDPPTSTKSFALSILDPHPVAKNWVHWLVINIPFRERRLVEGASRTNSLPPGAKELMNSFNELGYGGPAPPPGSGEHPYVATLYALNVESLGLGVDIGLRQFEKAIEGKVIEEKTLTGYYERS